MLKIIAQERPFRAAAVLVPVVDHPMPTVLLTQRSANLNDHAGQISFPGGKIESSDASPLDAALREAHEEVGLDAGIHRAARLSRYLRKRFRISHPADGGPGAAGIRLGVSAAEVEDAFEVPLAFLMDPDNQKRDPRNFAAWNVRFYAIPFEDRRIWGATAGMLRDLYRRISPPMIRPVLTEVGIFLIPFVVYAVFLLASRSGLLSSRHGRRVLSAGWSIGSLVLCVIGLILLANFSGDAAQFGLYSCAYREWQANSRRWEMSDARVLEDAPWLTSGPAARVLGLLNGMARKRAWSAARYATRCWGSVGDIDIATTAVPTKVIRRARAAGIKSVPTGIDHGTVTLVVDGQPFEVTTLREDTETFGRKAKVAFGRNWVHDAQRRDFTINGLSVDAGGIIHDHVGGLDDSLPDGCASSGIRTGVSPKISAHPAVLPHSRRLWRGEPDRAGYLACIDARAGLATLSAERVRMEMLKLMVAGGAAGSTGGDGGRRIAAVDLRRCRLYRAVCRDGRRGTRAWT